MNIPGTKEMLNIWERSRGKPLVEKTMDLLYLASPDSVDPATLAIGERDARLLQLRERMFGSELLNVAECPDCHERIEWTSHVGDLLSPNKNSGTGTTPFYTLEADEYSIRFRLPNSYDMIRVTTDSFYRSNPKKVFLDCIVEAKKDMEDCAPDDVPDEILNELDKRMAEVDPQAEIDMLLICPKCAHHWSMRFDILSYLWIEIDSWARHVLQEVITLASAFAWSESDILAMSPRRRQLYLQMIK